MNLIIIIIFGVLGIFVSLFNLVGAVSYISAQMGFKGKASVMPNTVWQLNTAPTLSTILLLVLKHWIFIIGILLPAIYIFFSSIKKGGLEILPSISGFLSRVIIVFGTAIIVTLSLTSRIANNATLLSWYFPVLIIVSFLSTWIANQIYSWLIAILSSTKRTR